MVKFLPAIAWAMVLLVIALGARLGLIEHGVASALLMTLPAVAFVTLLPRRSTCARRAGA